jgi:peptide/nickel transport system substrate-binding protein
MRKRFMAMVALLAMALLVLTACAKKETDKPESTSQAPKEVVLHGAWAYDVPPKSHFNVFVTGALTFPGGPYANLMTSPLALYYWHNDSWEKQLATDWQIDNAKSTITVSLRKGVKWSDGSEFKADDVAVYMWIGKAKNYSVWRYVDSFKKVDDYTVEFHLSNTNPIALYYILRMTPQPTSVYGEWAKKFEALYTAGKTNQSDEVKALVKEFDAFRPADYVASGPFKMDTKNITEAQLTLVKRADAWNADRVKIDKIVIYNGETATVTPLVLDKKIDFVTHAFPPATEQQFIAMGLRIIRFPYYTGPGIFFNHTIYPFNVPEFRQALAYAIDRSQAGTVALGKSGIAVEKMAGMADNMVKTWMDPADAAKLNPYKYDPKKAEELLTKLGFKKGADGIWVDDKGKKLEFEFSVPSDFADWSAAAENVAQQLTKFGIKTSIRGTVWSQYTTDMNAGKFQFGFLPWGSSTPHPQFAFTADLLTYNGGGKATPVPEQPGMNYPLKQKWSGGEIDFEALIQESGKGDVTNQKKAITTLALAFNELLPVIPVFERYSNAPILDGVNVTGWPKDGDPLLSNGSADSFLTPLIVTGQLRGAGK